MKSAFKHHNCRWQILLNVLCSVLHVFMLVQKNIPTPFIRVGTFYPRLAWGKWFRTERSRRSWIFNSTNPALREMNIYQVPANHVPHNAQSEHAALGDGGGASTMYCAHYAQVWCHPTYLCILVVLIYASQGISLGPGICSLWNLLVF